MHIIKNMEYLRFNKLFIIESLQSGDELTGTYLADELKKSCPFTSGSYEIELKSIVDRNAWEDMIEQVKEECTKNGIMPILHLEIHGDYKGLILTSGDFVPWKYIADDFREINYLSNCNLFVTFAVCHGMMIMYQSKISQSMPFCGAIGSFKPLYVKDLKIRFSAFYHELFSSLDIKNAMSALKAENTGLPGDYRYIRADELFFHVYSNYIKDNCKDNALRKRALDTIRDNRLNIPNNKIDSFVQDFMLVEHQNREKYYLEARDCFFMLQNFPNNIQRFDIPSRSEQLEERYTKQNTMSETVKM